MCDGLQKLIRKVKERFSNQHEDIIALPFPPIRRLGHPQSNRVRKPKTIIYRNPHLMFAPQHLP